MTFDVTCTEKYNLFPSFILDYCECNIYGDPHSRRYYKGKKLNFQGLCSYTLTKIFTDDCIVEVIGKHVPSTRFQGAATLYAILVIITKGSQTIKIFVGQEKVVKVSALYCSIRRVWVG